MNEAKVFKLDGKGSADTIQLQDYLANAQPNCLYWIRITVQKTTGAFLRKVANLPEFAIHALCSGETRPRTISDHEHMLCSLRCINLKKHNHDDEMASMGIWIQSNLIITTQPHHIKALSQIKKVFSDNIGPKTASDFLSMLIRNINEQVEDVLEDIDDQVDQLEDEAQLSPSLQNTKAIADIRRHLSGLRRYLSPQRDALGHAYSEQPDWFTRTDQLHLREAINSMTRHLEDLELIKSRAAMLQDQLDSTIQAKINQKMYALALVTMIFLPISFITSLLGINVDGIPGSVYRFGFYAVCGVLAVIVLITLLVLKRKKWL